MLLLLVFLGAGIGGAVRYLLGGWIQAQTGAAFPWGTLAVNVTGSFALALILVFLEGTRVSPGWRVFLGIGVCGGYTTFSTFGYETVRLLQDGQWSRAGAYVTLSVALSIMASFLGFGIAHTMLSKG